MEQSEVMMNLLISHVYLADFAILCIEKHNKVHFTHELMWV